MEYVTYATAMLVMSSITFFNCTSLSAERNEYIPTYYTNRASVFSFFPFILYQKNCKYLQIPG